MASTTGMASSAYPVPSVPHSTVLRESLFARLDRLAPLTVLHGPAQSGKTTLAASWAAERQKSGDTVWWVNVADVPYPGSAVEAVRLRAHDARGTRIVILDDADYLADPSVQSALVESLVLVPRLHLVICLRASHDLARRARAANLEVNLLAGALLNATAVQIPDFARSWGHDVTLGHARHLYGTFGGWLGVLRRALDGAHPEHERMGSGAASDYLREEILPVIGHERALLATMVVAATGHAVQPLLDTIFRVGTPAHGLLSGKSISDLLDDLSRRGIVERTRAAGEHVWRCPTLLARTLSGILDAQHPHLARYVHRTTANWLARHAGRDEVQLAGLAASHARAAGEWALLARIWDEHGLALTISHPQRARHVYYDIPDRVMAEHPELALAASVVSALGTERSASHRHPLIRNAQEAGWTLYALPPPSKPPSILGAAAQVISARHKGDVAEALRIAVDYAEHHLEPRSSEASLVHRAWFDFQWAITAFAARNASEAVNLLRSAAHYASAGGADAIVSAAAAQLAVMNAMAGHAQAAHEHLTDHHRSHAEGQWLDYPVRAVGQISSGILLLDQLDPTADRHFDIPGADHLEEWALVAWGRTQHALLFGDPIVALSEVNRLENLHRQQAPPASTNRRVIDRCVADLYLALGEVNRCQRYIDDFGVHQGALVVPRARLALICGDHVTARRIAASHAWDGSTPLRDRIDLLAIKAAAALRMGDRESARLLFTRAHQLAADSRTLIVYAVLPDDVREQLLEMIGNPLNSDALERIRRARRPYPQHGDLVSLSPRESVVLHAMVEHETLADIAEALVVSLNTIKKQAHAVYAKLDVHDRQSALLQAHKLGLIRTPSANPVAAQAGPVASR